MSILHCICLLPLLLLSLSSLAYSESPLETRGSTSIPHQHFRRSQIRSELGPLLSSDAVIVDAEGGNLTEATQRWQEFASPSFFAVVQVATESDIIQTVRLYMFILKKEIHCLLDKHTSYTYRASEAIYVVLLKLKINPYHRFNMPM